MRLILVDPNGGVCQAWREYFKDQPNVEIVHNYFEELSEFDCMVSAANSFGLMDGGVDAAITRYFGDSLMLAVQKRIINEYFGEEPVGTCMIVETGHPKHPFVAHTPTMRVPLTVAHTDHVYLAMWALLREIQHYNLRSERKIDTIACPGLGTATGRVPYGEAAHQMALAYRNFLNPPHHISWHYATERQLQVRFGGDDGLNFPPVE